MLTQEAAAVLDAADNWLTAVEAITEADETQQRTSHEQDRLDTAEVALADVVKTWRTTRASV
jgi:PBP1b-binding outer membrane lipoprotein LpoB